MSYLIKPLLDAELPVISHGRGIYLYDRSGNTYIDGCSGAITANVGHAVPEITDAIHRQMQSVSFVYRSQFTSEAAEALADALHQEAARFGDYELFFVNSGSEATETALKIAWQTAAERGETERNLIITRQDSYHGITLGALGLSMHHPRRKRFEKQLIFSPALPLPHCAQCPLGKTFPGCGLACADPLEEMILQYGAERIAAVITEPVTGAAAGAVVPPDGYDRKIAAICRKYGILWIADEVMCGSGRTGKYFAVEHTDAVPDIILLGKGLAAGYSPLAAVLVKRTVMQPVRNGSRVLMAGHTHCANPVATAAGLAVHQYILTNGCIANAQMQGTKLIEGLTSYTGPGHLFREVRGRGLLIGLEIHPDFILHWPAGEKPVISALVADAFTKGMLLYPAGGSSLSRQPCLLLAPPLTVSNEQTDDILNWMIRWITQVENMG